MTGCTLFQVLFNCEQELQWHAHCTTKRQSRDVKDEAQSRCCCCCCCCCGSCCGKTTCRVLLSSLLVLPCSHSFLPHFSSSASSARLWVSSALSSSRACSAALLAPRAVLRCGPLSTRIHQAFFHHVMCLFDTSFSCIEFVSFFSSTHSSCVVISSFPSCSSALALLRSS